MAAIGNRWTAFALAAACVVLLAGAFLAPFALPGDDPSDVVTRQTARVAVVFWGLAAGTLLVRRRETARWAWTLACGAYLVHVATAFDRVHATRLGLAAIDAAHERRWGVMPALRGTRIELVPLAEAVSQLRLVPPEEYAAAEAFFG